MQKFLKIKQVAERYDANTSTIRRWCANTEINFPKPIRFGPQTIRWRLADLEAWEVSRGADPA